MIRREGVCLLVCLFVTACATTRPLPPVGEYVGEGGERVRILAGERIEFDVSIQGTPIQRSFDYDVDLAGRIYPHPMTSVEAVDGVGRVEWLWKDDEIVAWDEERRTLKRYRRAPAD